MTRAATERLQRSICKRFDAEYCPTPPNMKVGISKTVLDGLQPINGLRHAPTGDTTGWYIWAGEEMSDADDFFSPLHAEHLREWSPNIVKYLGLPPGWRFLIAGKIEDVWFDESIKDVK